METSTRPSDFNTLIRGSTPVLVDFFATWCGPCKAMAPIMDDLKHRLGNAATLLKVDVDRNPQAAQAYGVKSVPTLILFKEGRVVWQRSGVVSASELEQVVRTHR